VWLFFILVISGRHSHRLCSVFIFVRDLRDSLLPPSGSFTAGCAPRRFIPRLRGPLGACFSFSRRSLSRLFIVQRFDFWVPCQRSSSWCWIPHLPPNLLFFFLTDFRFCLSALAQQGFVFPIFFMLLSHRAARTTIPCRFFASHRVAVLLL
jgi:hypothetical protein